MVEVLVLGMVAWEVFVARLAIDSKDLAGIGKCRLSSAINQLVR